MELMYHESVLSEGDAVNEAMMKHVSVAAAVMRLERGIAMMNQMPQMGQETNRDETVAGMEEEHEQEQDLELAHWQEEEQGQLEEQFNNINEDSIVLQPVACRNDELEIEKPNDFLRFSLRMGYGALSHPYEYAKTLMQLGHEPLPAIVSKNFLGRPTAYLSSVHEYIRFIKQTDGFIGLYRGLGARFISCASAAMFSESLVNILGMSRYNLIEGEKHPFKKYTWNLIRDGIVIITGLVFSHPFYVISVRQMGQFVGREIVYTGVYDSFREIWNQNGIMGFYAGFVPRLLCDLGVLFTTSTLSAIYNRMFQLKPTQKEYNSVIFQFGAIMIFYPLQVAAACMACSGSGIAAGAPPYMPIYAQWTDCLMDLFARGDHYRGIFIFRRTLPRLQMHRMHDIFPISRMI